MAAIATMGPQDTVGVFWGNLLLFRRAASFVDKILKGANPAELPVELRTRFYLTVNLKTADALGIMGPA